MGLYQSHLSLCFPEIFSNLRWAITSESCVLNVEEGSKGTPTVPLLSTPFESVTPVNLEGGFFSTNFVELHAKTRRDKMRMTRVVFRVVMIHLNVGDIRKEHAKKG